MWRYMLFIFVIQLSLLSLLACSPSEPQAESSDTDLISSPVAEVNAQVTKTTEPTPLLPTAHRATETTASFESRTVHRATETVAHQAPTAHRATETMAHKALPVPTVTVITTTPVVTESPALLASPTIPVPPTVISVANPYPEPIPTWTLIPVPPPPVATSWLTYTHPSGVSLQYPSDWQVEFYTVTEAVAFRSPFASEQVGYYGVMLNVYDRPLSERAIADPYSWDEKSLVKIHWAKGLVISEAEGLEFVSGVYGREPGQGWDGPVNLMAIYYSEPNELDIRLSTELDYESLQLVESLGFDEVIATRFQVFEQMAQSLVINR